MPEQQGERRPVSVLFADIVSSTAIAVRRYDGTVGRLMGDAILAFFGAPVAHEDDPERAVRAAFEMIGAVDALALGADDMRLQLRVGINTGPVLVGMVGTDVASEYTAMGDAVNVASRMPALASPGHIAVTADTHRFVAPLVDARDLGVVQVKGKAEGLHAYELTSLKDSPGRIRGVPGLESPLVGRDAQVAQLVGLFDLVRAGRGRVACVLGEPGIGKSRLLGELRSHALRAAPDLVWIEGRCVSYGQSLGYHLVLDLIRSAIGVTASASGPEVREALRSTTRSLFGDDWVDVYAYLGHLLSIDLEPEVEAKLAALEFEAMKRYIAAVVNLLRGLTARGPVVLVCEDVHWADPTSVDVIGQVLPLTNETPLLAVITSRVERDAPGWKLVAGARDVFGEAYSEVHLGPLSVGESRTLVSNLLEIESLPDVIRDAILTKSEGNPFFVEEMIRMLIEHGAIERQGDRWMATEGIARVEIPDSLQRLLLARIDRLPESSRR